MDNKRKKSFDDEKKKEKMIEKTNKELKRSLKDFNVVMDNHKNPRKYSEIFYEFMDPIIKEVIHDNTTLKKMLNDGQLIWNKAVAENFPEHPQSSEIGDVFSLFVATHTDKNLVFEILDRKKALFNNNNFFIVEQTSLLDADGKLAISVAVFDLMD